MELLASVRMFKASWPGCRVSAGCNPDDHSKIPHPLRDPRAFLCASAVSFLLQHPDHWSWLKCGSSGSFIEPKSGMVRASPAIREEPKVFSFFIFFRGRYEITSAFVVVSLRPLMPFSASERQGYLVTTA